MGKPGPMLPFRWEHIGDGRTMRRTSQAGVTLLELMVTIAVVAILTALAFPSFQTTMRSNRVSTAANELLTSMSLARSEAIRNTRGAGVCATADGASCGADWAQGWMVWGDTNANGAYDAGETVVKYSQARDGLSFNGTANAIGYDNRGRAAAGAQSVTMHPDGYATPVRCLLVNATGQARISEVCP